MQCKLFGQPVRTDSHVLKPFGMRAALLAVCLLVLPISACAQPTASNPSSIPIATQSPTEGKDQRDRRMHWWRDARFGMFVHWGLYSGLAGEWDGKAVGNRGGMEWIQQRVRAKTEDYAQQATPKFQPKTDFAKAWAKLAKQAGCKYLVFTTKHHDGFALHDSKVSEFDAGTLLQRDLVREIVDACRAEGLRVGFYHSVIDWHHDQYAYGRSKQLPHPLKGKPYPNGTRTHSKYVDYLHSQVDELSSNYGPIDVIWWDYSALDFQGEEAWRAFDLIAKVRKKHPDVIMNNRLFRRPEAGYESMAMDGITGRLDAKYGDFITPEQHVPDTGLPQVDWETCMTMNTTWGFNRHDQAWKSEEQLIHTLIDIASKGGNFLLNIGPTGDGTIPHESVERLEAMGRWMETNGESIYGSTISALSRPAWGRVTHNAARGATYLHVFDWPKDGKLTLKLEGVVASPFKATLLGTGKEIQSQRIAAEGTQKSVQLSLPATAPDPIATVIRITPAE